VIIMQRPGAGSGGPAKRARPQSPARGMIYQIIFAYCIGLGLESRRLAYQKEFRAWPQKGV
jgi:hypothetical protein